MAPLLSENVKGEMLLSVGHPELLPEDREGREETQNHRAWASGDGRRQRWGGYGGDSGLMFAPEQLECVLEPHRL